MPVSLSHTLRTFKFLTLFGTLVGTIDAGVTSGRFKGTTHPLLKPENCKKNFLHKKFHALTGARFISCPDFTVKSLVGVGMNISKIICFCKCRRIKLKLVIFLFYDLPTCNKMGDIYH